MLYFCRRGRQNLRELKTKDFSFTKDDKGARYVTKSGDELTKNRREDDEDFEGGMLFEKPGPQCFFASLELYIKHPNPKNEFLFQRPKKGSKIGVDGVCFDNTVVGESTLGEKMKCISKEAELSKIYTNLGYCSYNFWISVGMKHATSWLLVAKKVSQVYGAIAKQTLVRKNKCRKAWLPFHSTPVRSDFHRPPFPLPWESHSK